MYHPAPGCSQLAESGFSHHLLRKGVGGSFFLLMVQHSTPLVDWDMLIGNISSTLKAVVASSDVKRSITRHIGLAKSWKEENYLFLAKERTAATSSANKGVQPGNAESAAKN